MHGMYMNISNIITKYKCLHDQQFMTAKLAMSHY